MVIHVHVLYNFLEGHSVIRGKCVHNFFCLLYISVSVVGISIELLFD